MHKKGTRKRGRLWENVVENLNKIDGYKVDQRSVRERWAKLRKNLLKKNANEIKASGISPEMSESDILVEELINQEDDAEKIELKNDEEKKKQDGIAMRKQAMETFAETKKGEIFLFNEGLFNSIIFTGFYNFTLCGGTKENSTPPQMRGHFKIKYTTG
ncbi:uncharacterized protein LOC117123329 [Anneissia japonica]|uniref:uncharacterized protein LOC117123329 n=1 Tax=Anneissia japonica TaxID=1529436 RepID=UPI001425592F|nr:uncharacterized protein LOC117123329 [Anneissia japonica]